MPLPSVDDLLIVLPPWVTVTLLAGVANAALFSLLLGRRFRSLPLYLGLGVVAALLGQIVAYALLPPAGALALGEVHLPAVTFGAWLALAVARLLGL